MFKNSVNIVPLTQGSSVRTYGWVILFVWELNEECPFSVIPLRHFENCADFPYDLITGPLSDASRKYEFELSTVPGRSHSIFCKIELGKIASL